MNEQFASIRCCNCAYKSLRWTETVKESHQNIKVVIKAMQANDASHSNQM